MNEEEVYRGVQKALKQHRRKEAAVGLVKIWVPIAILIGLIVALNATKPTTNYQRQRLPVTSNLP